MAVIRIKIADAGSILKGSIIIVVVLLGFFSLYYHFVGSLVPAPFNYILCGLSAMFMGVSIGSFSNAISRFKDLALMNRFMSKGMTRRFKDGEKVAVFGHILPIDGNPIVSPFSKENSVFYSYQVYHMETRGSGDNRNTAEVNDYSGFCLTPSYIDSSAGQIKLLAYPLLVGFKENKFSYSDRTAQVYQNAFEYIANTKFEVLQVSLATIGKAIDMGRAIMTDDDGSIRQDIKSGQDMFDLKTRDLKEITVRADEQVCLMGIWSSQRNGIVPEISKGPTNLIRGRPEETLKVTRKDALKKIMVGIIIILAINLFVGAWWLALHNGAKISQTTCINGVCTTTPAADNSAAQANRTANQPPTTNSQTGNSEAWLNHTDINGNYRFSYPPSWMFNQTQGMAWDFVNEKEIPRNGSLLRKDEFVNIGFDYDYDKDCKLGLQGIRMWCADCVTYNSTLGGARSVVFEQQSTYMNTSILYNRYIYAANQNMCYYINLQDYQGNPNSREISSILSSFRFIN